MQLRYMQSDQDTCNQTKTERRNGSIYFILALLFPKKVFLFNSSARLPPITPRDRQRGKPFNFLLLLSTPFVYSSYEYCSIRAIIIEILKSLVGTYDFTV
ncbi:hypothetical protein Dimus_032010 [Dionaea muscipula]